jgi:hypothetical protein
VKTGFGYFGQSKHRIFAITLGNEEFEVQKPNLPRPCEATIQKLLLLSIIE